jgi:SAM-dependent methyltransferase
VSARSECFEHLPAPGKALAELARITKVGGTILIQSPSAYHVRNLNPFHALTTLIGRLVPSVLLRTVVQEGTFVHAFTYHWDFTRQDFARYTRGLPVSIESMTTAVYRFNPQGSRLHRVAAAAARWPVIRGMWWDMTVVLHKHA